MTAALCNSLMFPLSQQGQPWSPKEEGMVSDPHVWDELYTDLSQEFLGKQPFCIGRPAKVCKCRNGVKYRILLLLHLQNF